LFETARQLVLRNRFAAALFKADATGGFWPWGLGHPMPNPN
jgi:hypothetical protein